MTHLPFVASAYGLFVVAAASLAVGSARRLRLADARLATLLASNRRQDAHPGDWSQAGARDAGGRE